MFLLSLAKSKPSWMRQRHKTLQGKALLPHLWGFNSSQHALPGTVAASVRVKIWPICSARCYCPIHEGYCRLATKKTFIMDYSSIMVKTIKVSSTAERNNLPVFLQIREKKKLVWMVSQRKLLLDHPQCVQYIQKIAGNVLSVKLNPGMLDKKNLNTDVFCFFIVLGGRGGGTMFLYAKYKYMSFFPEQTMLTKIGHLTLHHHFYWISDLTNIQDSRNFVCVWIHSPTWK